MKRLASRKLIRFDPGVTAANFRLPRPFVLPVALITIGLIGWADYVTSWELSLFVLYGIPVFILAWFERRRAAVAVAVIGTAIWYFANLGSQTYRTPQGYAWAACNRFVYLVFVAYGGTAMRAHRKEIQGRLDTMKRARDLEHELIRISDREQMRIGQDLRDGLCQELAAIACAAACLKEDLLAAGHPGSSSAEVIQELLQKSIIEARNVARGISPVQIEQEGLPAALEGLVVVTRQLRQIEITAEIENQAQPTDPLVAQHLYRIGQEALSNAIRHSGGTRFELSIKGDGQRLHLRVSDNGCGFSMADSAGMGLQSMRYRADLIGGNLKIESRPEQGTMVTCSFPGIDEK